MEGLRVKEIAEYLNGKILNLNEDISIEGISTDSRKINKGDLFFALIGKNFDGHNYVRECINKGASLAIISKIVDENVPAILVEDTMQALRRLSGFYRDKFKIPFIAVTGSTGKTSTKEMIFSVLKEKFCVHKTEQNFNNEIGLPITLFQLEKEHEISVLEMGMNNPGEIKRLVEIAKPSIGVITNIGTAHIENLGTRENILKAKLELTTGFKENNSLIVNGDDDYLGKLYGMPYELIKISTAGNGNYNAEDIIDQGEDGVEFKCNYRGEKYSFKISLPGIHNVYNALFAIAVADKYNLTADEIKNGLINFQPGKLRMEIVKLENGISIINDCYNANVDSMKAALNVLDSFKCNRKIAILGDMYELGDYSREAHEEVGEYALDKCNVLIAVGEDAINMHREASKKIESFYFKTKEEACQFLKTLIKEGDTLLIKASRGMNMEYVSKFLLQNFGDRKEI